MAQNSIESFKTWLVYFMLLIYLVLSPVSGMLAVMGILPTIPWIYLILLLLLIYLFIKLLQVIYQQPSSNKDIYYFFALVILCYIIYAELISGWLLARSMPGAAEAIQTLLAGTVILFMVLFIAGGKLGDLYKLFQKPGVKITTVSLYLFFSAAIYWTAIMISSSLQNSSVVTLDARFNYLMISDTLVIFTLLIMWLLIKNTTLRWIVAFNSIALLYITRSRTAFFLFIFCLFISFLIQSRNKKNWLILGIGAVLFLLLGGSDFIFSNKTGIIFSLIFDTASDESYIARQQLLVSGMGYLKDYWLLGLPLAEIWHGSPGEYMHNYLSFWVCFGIIPFFSFIALSFHNFGRLFILMRANPASGPVMFLVSYFLFVYLGIISSRSYIYPYVWACLAAVPVFYQQHFKTAGLIQNDAEVTGGNKTVPWRLN
jgi:hypothetical protein